MTGVPEWEDLPAHTRLLCSVGCVGVVLGVVLALGVWVLGWPWTASLVFALGGWVLFVGTAAVDAMIDAHQQRRGKR